MESLSKQSQQVYQQIEQQCGRTSNKNQIKRIYTSHVCQLEQKNKQLQQSIVQLQQSIKNHQSKISDLNTQITNQIQSSKLQTSMFINKLSNMEIHYQQLMELFNTAKYLQYMKQFTTSDVLKKYHINELSLSSMNIQKNLMFRQGKIINSEEGHQERQIAYIPPLQQIMSQIPLVYQNQITKSNIHNYDFLPQLNTYYTKWLKRIRESVQFKKSQYRDQIISSNEVLKINNVHESAIFSLIVNYEYLKELNLSNCMLSDSHSQVFNQWYRSSLNKLDLSGNNITDKFIINIQCLLIQLTSLNICFSDITNVSMKIIGYLMKECRELDVSYTKVDEQGIQYIITLEKLEQLSIWSGQQHPECYRQYLLKNNEANLIRYKNNMIKISEYGIKLLSKIKLIKLTVDLNQQDGNIIVQQNNRLKYLHINGKIDSKSIINILEINKVKDVEVELKEIIVLGKVVIRGKKGKLSMEQLKKYIQDDQIIVEEIKIMGEQGYLKGQEIIRKFQLKSKRIGNDGAIQIARNLKCLTNLNLSYNSIGKEGAIQIARNLKCLTRLSLSSNSIGKEGAIQIARNLKCLTTLNLNDNSIGNEGAIQIARNLKCLTSLNLYDNSIGKEGAIQIARNMKCLTTLDLTWNSIGKEGAIQIARNLKCLTSLNLSNNSIGKEGAIQITRNLKCLTNLNLSNNSIGNQGAIQIARNLKCLTTLDLTYNSIGKEGAIQIARNLKCLTRLSVSYNSIGKEGAIQIARNLKCLTRLSVSYNSIGKEGAIQIARNLKCLTRLSLSSNSIGKEGAIQIARNLKCLTNLNLSYNSIGKEGAIQIARNLKSLTSLYLYDNSIGNEGAIQIARNLKSLTSLYLRNNNIDQQSKSQIRKLVNNVSL